MEITIIICVSVIIWLTIGVITSLIAVNWFNNKYPCLKDSFWDSPYWWTSLFGIIDAIGFLLFWVLRGRKE